MVLMAVVSMVIVIMTLIVMLVILLLIIVLGDLRAVQPARNLPGLKQPLPKTTCRYVRIAFR